MSHSKIDYEKSSLWALASCGSVGVGPAGLQLFDLANRMTNRAHRLQLVTTGKSLGLPIPISASFGASDYVNFRTPREVNFFDFDGTFMTVRETNAGFYLWTTVSFWGQSVRIAGGGLNIPGLGVSSGIANIIFGRGRPIGDVDMELKPPPVPKEPGPFKEIKKEDALAYRVPNDILFAFNRYHLKPGAWTENALGLIGGLSERFSP